MKHAFAFILLFTVWVGSGQTVVDPHTFTQETNPDNSNFEFYSRATGVNRRATFTNVRKRMTPTAQQTSITYYPAPTGNTSNLGEVVRDPSGNIWYIDGLGQALRLNAMVAGSGISIAGDTITAADTDPLNEAWTIDGDDADQEVISNQVVKFQGAGIITTDYVPGTNTLVITGTEVDGSTTNEIQQIDTFSVSGSTLSLSLSGDGVPAKTVTISGGSGGVDSTFVKLSGSYASKRITDNIYRYGTAGHRTSDTTGVLNLASAVASKPVISAIDNPLLLQYQRGTMPPWRINQTNSSNGDGTTNNVLQILYNGLNGFTKDNADDAVFGMGMEPHWVTGEGDTVAEWHVYFNDINGDVHRPITGFFDYHNPLESSWGFGTEFIHVDGALLNQHAKLTINRTNSSSAFYPLEVYKHKKTITPTSTSYTSAQLDSVTCAVFGNYSTGGESPATGLAALIRLDNTQERGAAFYMGLVDQSGAGFDSGSDFVMLNNNSGSWKESIRIKDANGNVGIKQIAPTQALDVGGNQLLRGHLRANTVGDSAGITIKLPNAAGATPSLEWEFSTGAQGAYAHLYPYNSTTSTANASIAFGKIGSMHTLSYKNTVVGITGATFATGTGNTSLLGWGAGNALNGGYENTFLGSQSGYSTNTGYQNTCVGIYAGYTNTNGVQNMFLGRRAGYTNLSGSRNVGVGVDALRLNSTGDDNVAIGGQAGDAVTGSDNTIIGASAGRLVTGDGNILIGRQAGETQTSISNQLYIDNSNTSTPLISGDLSANRAGVNIAPGSLAADWHVGGWQRVDGLGLFRGAGSATGSTTAAGIRLYNTTSTETYNIAAKDGGGAAIYDNGGSEAWTMTAAGLIGMGDTSPEEKLDVDGNVKALHYIGQSTAPGIAKGADNVVGTAASGATVSLSGTDAGFEVTLTTGSAGISTTGDLFTVTFNAAYGAAPVVVYSASNAAAGSYTLTGYTYSTATTTTVVITNAITNLTDETDYKWSFVVMGK